MKDKDISREEYRPGCGILTLSIFAGLLGMIVLPVVTLWVGGILCALGMFCFLADPPTWAMVVLGIMGLGAGGGLIIELGEKAHKRQRNEALQRRLNEAQLRWLEQQENKED